MLDPSKDRAIRKLVVHVDFRPHGMAVNVISSAVSLTVADPAASSKFLTSHLGFREILINADFITLGRDDAAVELVLVRHDPELDRPGLRPAGVIVSFAITGIAAEYERLLDEGADIG